MSFTINFYSNQSEDNKIQKTLYNVTSATGSLRDMADILNPTILVEGDISTFAESNYMYISEFSRYYFITGIKAVRTNLCEISARVDVLMTYANQILKQNAIIYRQENKWNLYLDDGSFKTYQNPNVVAKAFPSGFNTMEFVLAVAGS